MDPAKPLLLGGIHVRGETGLDGNSDADVILHALCRALEQAIGRDSFSEYADAMSRQGITDSKAYVAVAMSHVNEAGYRVGNVGVTVEAARPRIDALRAVLKGSIAALLGVDTGAVGINATSGEGMTPFGKGEGIQAFAIVTVIAS